MKTTGLGIDGEQIATDFLKEHGYHIICRNFISRFGEIDIIGRDGKYLAFVEVKTRKSSGNIATGFEAIDVAKQKKIIRTANYFLLCNKQYARSNLQPRFDCIEIDIDENTGEIRTEMLKNAFEL